MANKNNFEITNVDKILFRSSLKNQIQDKCEEISELKNEISELKNELNKIDNKRREAITNEQKAYEERNKMEDKVAELKDKLKSEREKTDANMLTSDVETYKVHQTEDLFTYLSDIQFKNNNLLTAIVQDKNSIPFLLKENVSGSTLAKIRNKAPILVLTDENNIINIGLDLPRLPESICEFDDSFYINKSWMHPTGEFAFALIRSDIFAISIYDNDIQQSFESFKSRIDKSHSKGGFSQSRFEQHREEQIKEHITKAEEELRKLDDDLPIILVGDEKLVKKLSEYAEYTDTVSASGIPDDALSKAYSEFWSIKKYNF